jgi:carboxypeptidase Q
MKRFRGAPTFPGRAFSQVCLAIVCGVWLWLPPGSGLEAQTQHSWLNAYRRDAANLIKAATADDFAWRRLAELTDLFGARPSGSESLDGSIAWAVSKMKADGLENVRTESVMVPRWIRGHERADIVVDVTPLPIAVLGLGGSVATPPGGVEAEVLVVASFEDLNKKSADARGRIVLLNAAFTSYSDTVSYRTNGARVAAQHGAVAVLVRSVGPIGLRTVHTGSVQYAAGTPRIPAAAVAVEDAMRIERLAASGRRVRARLVMEGRYEPDVESANVVAELRGREVPEEIVLVGGHIDSWDVGTGASDDGVGCIVTWEALRLMKALNIRPRRTVRLVLWTNEENGFSGANAYVAKYVSAAQRHVLAIESDSGVFAPASLGFSGSAAARMIVSQIATLLAPIGFTTIGPSGGGADIEPIAEAGNVPTMALLGDSARYFVIHHTAADTVERMTPDEVSKAAAAIAVMTYVVAEMPERLPR